MSRKILSFILIPVVMIGVWVYTAFQFQAVVMNKIIPKLNNSEFGITTNTDAIEINKFFFRVHLKDTVLFAGNDLIKTTIGNMHISYNPFHSEYALVLDKNANIVMGTGKYAHNITAKRFVIISNKELVKGNPYSLQISLEVNDLKATSTLNGEQLLAKADNVDIDLTTEEDDDDMLTVGLSITEGGVRVESQMMEYMEDVVDHFMSQSSLLKKTDFEKKLVKLVHKYNAQIMDVLGDINTNYEYNLALKKETWQDVFLAATKQKSFEEVFSKFDFIKDAYSLDATEETGNELFSIKSTFNAVNDSGEVKVDGSIDSNSTLNNQQKEKLSLATQDLFAGLFKQFEFLSVNAGSVSGEDFKALSNRLVGVNNVVLGFSGSYKAENSQIKHNLNIKLGDFEFAASGETADNKHSGKFAITTPELFTSGLIELYGDLKPMLAKVDLDTQYVQGMADNIKNNGKDFISVFNKNTNANEKSETDLLIDLTTFDFKINDHSISELLKDSRAEKFLNSIPVSN